MCRSKSKSLGRSSSPVGYGIGIAEVVGSTPTAGTPVRAERAHSDRRASDVGAGRALQPDGPADGQGREIQRIEVDGIDPKKRSILDVRTIGGRIPSLAGVHMPPSHRRW